MGSSVVLNKNGDRPGKRRGSRPGRRFQKNSPQRIRIRMVRMGSKKGSGGHGGLKLEPGRCGFFYMKFI